MFRKIRRLNNGGFVFAEFAIALPLLIFLMYGLATVGLKIFQLGKIQLADYVLEEEVHDVLSRLIYDARAAKEVDAVNSSYEPTLTFTYRTINEIYTRQKIGKQIIEGKAVGDVIADKEETRVYKVIGTIREKGSKIDYKRQIKGGSNPITGDNYFGRTRITQFEFSSPARNVLQVTLEMESEETQHKIKISTAVYMPGLRNF